MSEGPILHIYKYGRKTELHTDACKQGYGAISLQEAEDGKLYPVYYMSKKTNTAEEKYDSYELEKTMQKKDLITRIARWALQLEEFNYEHRAEVVWSMLMLLADIP
ncbi:retrovirus-related Pol polyprotein from transposon 17.6 [Trichonephila clavipes]|nr:retrovirus-related Pol polyprotein from transposon 17.6 [Trichonephila clavipes]